MLCMICRPITILNANIFRMDSPKWEQEQRLKGLHNSPKLFRLLEAHRGNVTRVLWQDARRLMFDSSICHTMPREQITLHSRAFSFAAVSRLQGSVHYYLDMVWDGFSFRTFRMLDETLDLDKEVSDIHSTCPGLREKRGRERKIDERTIELATAT